MDRDQFKIRAEEIVAEAVRKGQSLEGLHRSKAEADAMIPALLREVHLVAFGPLDRMPPPERMSAGVEACLIASCMASARMAGVPEDVVSEVVTEAVRRCGQAVAELYMPYATAAMGLGPDPGRALTIVDPQQPEAR